MKATLRNTCPECGSTAVLHRADDTEVCVSCSTLWDPEARVILESNPAGYYDERPIPVAA